MQTFLPYENFEHSARVLDMRRLNKQRVEVKQILKALDGGPNAPWARHPAVRMWDGHKSGLALYGIAMCAEFLARGGNDRVDLLGQFAAVLSPAPELPPWLGVAELHASHRANLLRKDPAHYGQFRWEESPAEGYWWPTANGY